MFLWHHLKTSHSWLYKGTLKKSMFLYWFLHVYSHNKNVLQPEFVFARLRLKNEWKKG